MLMQRNEKYAVFKAKKLFSPKFHQCDETTVYLPMTKTKQTEKPFFFQPFILA